jgi:hypothetical protein
MVETKMIKKYMLAACLLATPHAIGLAQPATAAAIQFDDIANAGLGVVMPRNYAGLVWDNFRVLNAEAEFRTYGANGYTAGMQSRTNVAFNFLGNPSAIKSAKPFDVGSLYATAAWTDGLNLTISARRGTQTVFSGLYVLSADVATRIVLNLAAITSLHFSAEGGATTPRQGSGTQFALDDINVIPRNPDGTPGSGGVSDVPLPAALPLLAAALSGLASLGRTSGKSKAGKT